MDGRGDNGDPGECGDYCILGKRCSAIIDMTPQGSLISCPPPDMNAHLTNTPQARSRQLRSPQPLRCRRPQLIPHST